MFSSSRIKPTPAPPPIPEPYLSRQLDTTADGIRLVTIDPDLNPEGLLTCRLQTTTFAQRPRYETLSYRWGDESTKETIIVDGVRFRVTANLFEALHYFRAHARQDAIWIDAICINQTDIPERSSQLRIMPHIYARATSTLVWLGGRYINLPINLGPNSKSDPEPNADIKDKIISDGYWDRVWILQEIGKARKIHLCFGQEPAEWDRFISWIRKHDDVADEAGPLKLDRLRKDKYDGSCSLRQLLTNHATALSKDPRDKIYGLVGLSTDGRGFPMDYNKTLLEVWTDTIHFMSRHDLLPDDCAERVQFCSLVRDLLGGEELGSVSGVVQLHHAPGDESFYDSHNKQATDEVALSALSFFAEVYGVIVSLGPSASELLSSLELTDAWEEELQRMYRGNLDSAHMENDNLMRRIFDAPDGKLVNRTNFQNHKVVFHGPEIYGPYWSFMHKERHLPPGLEGSWNHRTSTPDEPRLAMLKISSTPWDQTPYKLAFVAPDALQGDFVCRIDGFPMKRVVVRPAEEEHSNNVRMHVCGTAITVRDVLADEYFDDGNVQMSYKLDLLMDARTLYALIFGNDDKVEEERLEEVLGRVQMGS
ncbi:heterokaryon incompatibility [Pochonia chlamydosporia 170]|uniref:Heterokaryon incompatibility n=1 Tax=Pochonia chlamydosporia 170 TaxID=1380566 RepID=A0A179FIF7_METCM|nr:heterokaryon incompatibility [Pochonia chlamydosporia 170]OAQ65312.1 heterokaryon incompatibility [Pochonia chlamydosporia 170]